MSKDPEKKREEQRRYDATEKGRERHRRYNALPHRKLAQQLKAMTEIRIRY